MSALKFGSPKFMTPSWNVGSGSVDASGSRYAAASAAACSAWRRGLRVCASASTSSSRRLSCGMGICAAPGLARSVTPIARTVDSAWKLIFTGVSLERGPLWLVTQRRGVPMKR